MRKIIPKVLTLSKVFLLFLSSTLSARPYVITDKKESDHSIEKKESVVSASKRRALDELSSRPHEHSIALGGMFTYNNIQNFHFKGTSDFYTSGNFRVKSYNLFASYERRLSDILGVGLMLQRTHLPSRGIGVYSNAARATPVDVNGQNISGFSCNESNAFLFARQYILPQSFFDPFLELGFGAGSQRGTLHVSNGSQYTHRYNNPFIFMLGAGAKMHISRQLALQGVVSFRNQKSAQFKVSNTISGKADYYRNFDFRLALTYGW